MVRRRWQGGDAGLTARMLVVMVLLVALYLAFVAVLVQAGVQSSTILVFAAVVAAVQLFSDKIALWSVGARVVTEQEEPELHAAVERLAVMADLPKPTVAMAPTLVPNAFAVGRGPGSSTVTVTRGLLNRLEPAELEGV